ncbi:MAG: hypothetical protein LBR30_06965 [Clostridioides sp.]|nr:hypothetical protein [Clostridioides sp.]
MKKLLVVCISLMILVGCGSNKGLSNGKYIEKLKEIVLETPKKYLKDDYNKFPFYETEYEGITYLAPDISIDLETSLLEKKEKDFKLYLKNRYASDKEIVEKLKEIEPKDEEIKGLNKDLITTYEKNSYYFEILIYENENHNIEKFNDLYNEYEEFKKEKPCSIDEYQYLTMRLNENEQALHNCLVNLENHLNFKFDKSE